MSHRKISLSFYDAFFLTAFVLGATAHAETVSYEKSNLQSNPGRQVIESMKEAPRGPFKRLRWFCNDGSVHPPSGDPCHRRGGGHQHGQLTEDAERLRNDGYSVGTLFVRLPDSILNNVRESPRVLASLILERFLISWDEGWVYRKAKFYRGGIQHEDEATAAKNLLLALLSDPQWRRDQFLVLREAARLFPREKIQNELHNMRALAAHLSRRYSTFKSLRDKLHSLPELSDADQVATFAANKTDPRFQELEAQIRNLFGENVSHRALTWAAAALPDSYREELRMKRETIYRAKGHLSRSEAKASLLLWIRDTFNQSDIRPEQALSLLDASIVLEDELSIDLAQIYKSQKNYTRDDLLSFMLTSVSASYGSGLLSQRAKNAAFRAVLTLRERNPNLKTYEQEIRYLEQIPAWAHRNLQFMFQPAVEKMTDIEPLAREYMVQRVRSSALTLFAFAVRILSSDLNELTNVSHSVFSQNVQTGIRVLNTGSGEGPLRDTQFEAPHRLEHSIVITDATTAELPRVSGIITRNEGNVLSHVQLLARDLGVPNVVVSPDLMPLIQRHRGSQIRLEADESGSVTIRPAAQFTKKLDDTERTLKSTLLEPDMNKLTLEQTAPLPLSAIDSSDSGRIVGPKAAHAAHLMKRYPGQVPNGLVIPFGMFNAALSNLTIDGVPLKEWIKRMPLSLQRLPKHRQAHAKRMMLEKIRKTILGVSFSAHFRQELRTLIQNQFGTTMPGLFVRSDTNVEDLPNFTGAGLNLTVANVTSFNAFLDAIRQVWASPFQERAFSWRQARMKHPEDVYVSILVMETAPVEKSGVMITADVSSGNQRYLSIGANFGVGGVVSNQAAETILVDRKTGLVRLLSEANVPFKKVPDPKGGITKKMVNVYRPVLTAENIQALNTLAESVHAYFPDLLEDEKGLLAADIEFGFIRDSLILFQIRPFPRKETSKKYTDEEQWQKVVLLSEFPKGTYYAY